VEDDIDELLRHFRDVGRKVVDAGLDCLLE